MFELTAELALELVDTARREAESIDRPMSLGVVDGGGHPVAMLRMDGASILSAGTVLAKARTAVFFGRPTHVSVERAKSYPEVYSSLAAEMQPGMVYSMGGYPLWVGTNLLGAVAASGGSGEEDMQVAGAALERYKFLLGEAVPDAP